VQDASCYSVLVVPWGSRVEFTFIVILQDRLVGADVHQTSESGGLKENPR